MVVSSWWLGRKSKVLLERIVKVEVFERVEVIVL